MSELAIQKYLRDGRPLHPLREEPYHLGISANGPLIGFKYNQIKSDMSLEICQEARGVILDMSDNWNVVSYPFKKFFNEGEKHAANVDLSTATVFEKLDGTAIVMYFYNNKWSVQTLGTVDASGPVVSDNIIAKDFGENTFADLFWHAFNIVYPNFDLNVLDTNKNYIFELATPYNRIVTKYDEYKVVLIGVRNRVTLQEEVVDTYSGLFALPRTYTFKNLSVEQLRASLDLFPVDEEGYVVCDAQFNRVKMKNPAYVLMHKQKDNIISKRNALVSLILDNKEDDLIASFPEFKESIETCKLALKEVIVHTEHLFEQCGGLRTNKDDKDQRKAFALEVLKLDKSYQPLLFTMLSQDLSAEEAIKLANLDLISYLVDTFQTQNETEQ